MGQTGATRAGGAYHYRGGAMSFFHQIVGPQVFADAAAEARVRKWVRGENLNPNIVTLYRTPKGEVLATVLTDSRLSPLDMLSLHVVLTDALEVDQALTKPALSQLDDKLKLLRKLWPQRYRDTAAQVWEDRDVFDPYLELRDECNAWSAAAELVMSDMRYDDVDMAFGFSDGW